ncbi:MAG: hypothetical protein HOG92_04710 [Methylococcales bacterium]|nr:hypothetical protein [Methylococcales bacterium]MBT3699232.1 hypothetical protein [Methylococcales bacterium]MBT3815763.1 hypothetical protein [Methylococcales bacterium]MBT4031680.1 hypothetical protein [Methylococcales bacterium]MBT4348986.1 hypothetical protein [Methylococcales bacterium]
MFRGDLLSRNKSTFGVVINQIQTLFVSSLRIWTIPIVLMLSIASGFTTYYGMSHFIIPWIALVITIAIQSIIVICSLELAGIHWRANRFRYFSVLLSLIISLAASISFSYFKFYEVSERETIQNNRLIEVRQQIEDYINSIVSLKTEIFEQKRAELELASKEVSAAYFGTHPEISVNYKNQVGQGPFWKRFNELYQNKREENKRLEETFILLNEGIRKVQSNLNYLGLVQSTAMEKRYQSVQTSLQAVQLNFHQIAFQVGHEIPQAPVLMTYGEYTQGVKPSFAMWGGLSVFALVCAAMVDFFTVLLSYRLEFKAPAPLSEQEEDLVFQCIREFNEFRINENDELEMIIEKSPIEKARRYSDWSRMFAVGFLLSRGFLRKIDRRTVEFAPNLYPLIADRLGVKLKGLVDDNVSPAPVDE